VHSQLRASSFSTRQRTYSVRQTAYSRQGCPIADRQLVSARCLHAISLWNIARKIACDQANQAWIAGVPRIGLRAVMCDKPKPKPTSDPSSPTDIEHPDSSTSKSSVSVMEKTAPELPQHTSAASAAPAQPSGWKRRVFGVVAAGLIAWYGLTRLQTCGTARDPVEEVLSLQPLTGNINRYISLVIADTWSSRRTQ
jgi:hypothetical protein